MAANPKGRAIAGGIGKRIANQIWAATSRDTTPAPVSAFAISGARRRAHVSSYDKNVEEQVRPTVVPDHVIQPMSDKYWEPHPKTGVFGPADQLPAGESAASSSGAASAGYGSSSALEQTAWFRPLEDVDKPPHP